MRHVAGLLFVLLSADVADACSVAAGGSARDFIEQADAIVRARAIAQRGQRTVTFEAVETLKGRAPQRLEFDGELHDAPDSNDPWLPRTFVRRLGRRGNCYALHYRAGAEYLLLLQRDGDTLTPYWAEMAPVNEELTGPDDPWLRWVREYLALSVEGPAIDGTLPASCDPNMDLRPGLLCHFALNDRTPFSLDGYGTLKRLHRNPATIELPLPDRYGLERLWVVDRTAFVLLVFEVTDGENGRGEIVRLNPATLEIVWRLSLPGFNASPATIEETGFMSAQSGP